MKPKTIIKLIAGFITIYTVGEMVGTIKTIGRIACTNSFDTKTES